MPINEQILQQLRDNDPTLSSLNLSDNQIGLTSIFNWFVTTPLQKLMEALKDNNSLTTLYLGSNNLDEAAAQALTNMLATNTTLTTLNLWDNKIGEAGAAALAKALTTNTTLTSLNLSWNNLGEAGAKALAKALTTNTTLTTLDLSVNQLGEAGAAALANALTTNTTLTTLDLENNKIGDAGAAALAKALTTNTTLTTLYLSINKIGDAGAKALANALTTNTTLTTLYLVNNQLGDAGAAALANALATNTALTTLYLSGNKLSAAHEQRINECLARKQALAQQMLQAATQGDLARVKALRQQGVSWQMQDSKGNSALHLAAKHGHLPLVQWLVAQGVVINARNKDGQTALAVAHQPAIRQCLTNALTPAAGIIKIALPPQAAAKQATQPTQTRNQHAPLVAPSRAPAAALPATPLTPSTPAKTTLVPTIARPQITLGKKLGQGGFGYVFAGSWQHNEVAIKTLLSDMLSEEALDEFQHETTLMSRLNHPNIVRLYGVSCEAKPYYMVLELMTHGALYGYLRQKNPLIPLTLGIQQQIARDITKGLAFLHGQVPPIIHRDLKSQNVLLDERLHAKLADFGLAKVKTETTATCSSSASSAGTNRWMGPELFKRGGKQTTKSDMFSYAVTLWELVARKLPFADAANGFQVTQWIIDGERETIPADCPALLVQLITTCWAAEPNKRLTAEEALTRLVAEPSVTHSFRPS